MLILKKYADAQRLTKQSESLQSKLKEAKKKNKSMKEDFSERRKMVELIKYNNYNNNIKYVMINND